jgi:hypothetical protein
MREAIFPHTEKARILEDISCRGFEEIRERIAASLEHIPKSA